MVVEEKRSDEIVTTASSLQERGERVYEIGYHIVPSLDEHARGDAVDALRSIVEKHSGTILNEVYPELIDLAYPMSREIAGKRAWFSVAYFGWMFAELTPPSLLAVEKEFANNPNVIRFLVIRSTKEHSLATPSYSFRHRNISKGSDDAYLVLDEGQVAPMKEKPEVLSEEEVDKAIEDLVSDAPESPFAR